MKQLHWRLLALVLALSGFGLLMVFEASSAEAIVGFNDKYYFLKEQAKWLMLGLAGAVFFAFFDYRKLYYLSPVLLVFTIILLGLVFFPGVGIETAGAKRWLNFGLVQFQPAEFAKPALIIYLAAWFSSKEKGRLTAFLLLLVFLFGLIVLEPDLGTAIVVLAISFLLYFFSGANIWQFLGLIPAAGLLVAGLAMAAPYRLERLKTFFNPNLDPLGASYHIHQVLLALGSGGFLGLGLGESRQKYQYLPEAMTDSIFAIIGEEFGFVGASLTIILFVLLVVTAFKISLKAGDRFGQLLGLGIASWFGTQSLINLLAMAALVPLTGVPLPFISYGGSALVTGLAGAGMLLSIYRYR